MNKMINKTLVFVLLVSLLVFPETWASDARQKYNFNSSWKFVKANILSAADAKYDDTSWETVSCPHTFNDIDTFDDFAEGGHNGESKQWRGTVWYRKHFSLPLSAKGKKVYIEFEGVRQIADVYINGTFIGKNQTGFIPFGYDLTPYIKFGEDNVVAVKVNNDRGDHFRDNFPLVWHHEHWHPNHGGIYRNVYLHVMNPLHITLPLYDNLETQGQYIYTEKVSKRSADVYVETEIRNEGNSYPSSLDVQVAVFDADGNLVKKEITKAEIPSGKTDIVKTKIKIKKPSLWSTRYPYLYRVETSILQNGQVIDSDEQPLGIRYFEFNPNTGFHINGESVKLHGWGQKPTNEWAGLGSALPDWMREYTYRLMDEAGGNFVRWGHCACSPAEALMGDKFGFVTMMPGVAGESTDEGETWKIRLNAFRDMVVCYRNHPSVFIWEGGNWAETDEHYQELCNVISTFDSKGNRLYGHRRSDLHDCSSKYVTIEIGTEGWEREFEKLPIIESEYCRDESPRRIWDKYSPDDNFYSHPNIDKNVYKWSSEEYAVKQVEHWWNKMGKKAYHCGGANWVFTDGPHGGRCQTEVTRASGEVDAVRLPKEAFYSLKSIWRTEPQVNIVGHWNYKPETVKTVYVTSNCQSIKLFVNDKLVAENSKPTSGYVFSFPNVKWESGKIKAEAYIDGKLVAESAKQTSGKAVSLRITPITGSKGWQADGSDIVLLDVEAVDAQGRRCPLNTDKVYFTVEGPAIWRGGYNSGLANSTNNQFLNLEAGINRVALKSMLQSGKVTVTASTVGHCSTKESTIKPATITLETKPVELFSGLSEELPYELDDIMLSSNDLVREPAPAYSPYIEPYIPGVSTKSKLFTRFSYTGDSPALLRTTLDWGKRAYTDLTYNYTVIPSYVRGAEYVRMPNSDYKYWARDQLQFVAGVDMTVYVAHDDRVKRPQFLETYTDTGDDIKLGDVVMSLFKYEARKGESIIMAGNSDVTPPEGSRMYVVFGKERK